MPLLKKAIGLLAGRYYTVLWEMARKLNTESVYSALTLKDFLEFMVNDAGPLAILTHHTLWQEKLLWLITPGEATLNPLTNEWTHPDFGRVFLPSQLNEFSDSE